MTDITNEIDFFLEKKASFAEMEKAKKNIISIFNLFNVTEEKKDDFFLFLNEIAGAPDPDLSLNSAERIASSLKKDLLTFFKNNREYMHNLLRLFSASRLAANIIMRNPEEISSFFENKPQKEIRSSDILIKELEENANYEWNQEKFSRFLLKFREIEIFHIMAMDYFEIYSFEESVSAISGLAKALIEIAFRYAAYQAEMRYGTAVIFNEDGEQAKSSFSVIALGKLGGDELNYFSDIDLLFIYTSDRGKVYRDIDDSSSETQISLHEYYTKLAEILTAVLRSEGGDNSVYRVDLRLRPEGRSGDLVNSLRSIEIYYESWGQTWERQMLIKASHAGGDSDLSEEFLKIVEPFIYRKHLDYRSIDEIRNMKGKIDRSLKANGESLINVKKGYGGIREIEFFIQALQLIYGGRDKSIRSSSSILSLKKLYESRYINFEDFNILTRSYKFLRTIEHRLQMMDGRQTQLLPEDNFELSKVAKRLGYTVEGFSSELDIFESDYKFFTGAVRDSFDHLFAANEEKEEIEDKDKILMIWEESLSEKESLNVLREMGFSEPEKAAVNISRLREGKPFAHYSSKIRRKMAEAAPILFQEILSTADPDRALNNLEKFVSSSSMKETVFPFLTELTSTREILLNIFSNSQFISEMLVQRPQLIDFINYSEEQKILESKKNIVDKFNRENGNFASFKDMEDELIKLASESIFRVGVDDILCKEKTLKISNRLSIIADSFLELVLHISVIKCRSELGINEPGTDETGNLAIYGLGKLGGREIIYSSDLDIIFVYSGNGRIRTKNGDIGIQEYYTKIAVQVLETAKEANTQGVNFVIDSRLRPSGTSGVLVQDANAYINYFSSQAKVWEKQAFTRLRHICGIRGPIAGFEKTISDIIYDNCLPPEEAREINKMRERMEIEIAGGKKQYFHIKFGEGGIVDIEFLVQALMLRYGKNNSKLMGNNTMKGLKKLHLAGIIERNDYSNLVYALLFLRTVENRIRILENRPLNIFYKKPEKIVKLAMRAGYRENKEKSPAEQLIADYEKQTETVRKIYNKFFSALIEK